MPAQETEAGKSKKATPAKADKPANGKPEPANGSAKKAESKAKAVETTFGVKNPLTGEVIRELPIHTATDLAEMALNARKAQQRWATVPFRQRAEAMMRFSELVLDRLDEGIEVIRSETGKTWTDAHADFLAVLNTINYYCKKGGGFLADERRSPWLTKNKAVYVSYKPIGLAGIIAPWNFPFELAVSEAITAMLAGCAVIVKPSEVTPLIALWAADLFREVGLPDHLLQIATGKGETGAALIRVVDRITFTGSTRTGRKVAVACAERLIPYTLELGGKDAMIICDDADIEKAAGAAVFGGFFNAGQMCTSIERVYVHEDVYDEFVRRVVERVGSMRLTETEGEPQDFGSMTFEPQIDIVEGHVEQAREAGASILTGGKRRPDIGPLVYEPTVLTGVDHSMEIMREESFGPILPIMKVRSDEEAIRLANDSPYGLNSAVWSRDIERARDIARRLDVGTTEINDAATSHLLVESPFGGVKDSGVGRRKGPSGIRKYTQQQTVARDLFSLGKNMPFWYPLPSSIRTLMRKAIHGLWRRSWTDKIFN